SLSLRDALPIAGNRRWTWLGQDVLGNDILGLFLAVDKNLLNGALALTWHAFFDDALFALFQVLVINVVWFSIKVFGQIEFLYLYAVHNDLGAWGKLFLYPGGNAVIRVNLDAALF